MPLELTAVVGVSVVVLVVLLALSARSTGRWRGFALELAAIVAFVVFLNRLFDFPFPPPVAAKGKSDNLVLAGALFICMLLGMLSQFLYRRFESAPTSSPELGLGHVYRPGVRVSYRLYPAARRFSKRDHRQQCTFHVCGMSIGGTNGRPGRPLQATGLPHFKVGSGSPLHGRSGNAGARSAPAPAFGATSPRGRPRCGC